MTRLIRKSIEILAAAVGVLALMLFLLVWWLANYPIDSTNITPYVQEAMTELLPRTTPVIGRAKLLWDASAHALTLEGEGAKFLDKTGRVVGDVPRFRVRLNLFDFLRGRFVPRTLEIESLRLELWRRKTGQLVLAGLPSEGKKASLPTPGDLALTDVLADLGHELTHPRLQHDVEFTAALFKLHDEETGGELALLMPHFTLHHDRKNLTGEANLLLQNGKDEAKMALSLTSDREKKTLSLRLDLAALNPAPWALWHPAFEAAKGFDAPLSGHVSLVLSQELAPLSTEAAFQIGQGVLTFPEFWDAPRPLKKAVLSGSYEFATKHIEIKDTAFDFGGPKLGLALSGAAPERTNDALLASLFASGPKYDLAFVGKVALANVPMDQLATIWPRPVATSARAWVTSSMAHGIYTHADVTIKGRANLNDLDNASLDFGEGKIEAKNGRVTYLAGMPPLEGTSANATFDLDHMEVQVLGGGIGSMKLAPTTLTLSDFQKSVQYIHIPVKISGPVSDALRLLDSPPLGYAKAIGLDPDDVEGRVEGLLDMNFPLLNDLLMKDVSLKAEAKLDDFSARKLVTGLDITGGSFALNVDKEGFGLKGPAQLNGLPFQIVWQGNFGAQAGVSKPLYQATLSGALSGDVWRTMGSAVEKKIKGAANVSIKFIQPRKSLSQLSGEINLKQTTLSIEELGWDKPEGTPATFSFAADLQANRPIQVKTIELDGPTIKAKGKATLERDSLQLLSIDLTPLVVGRTNANIHFKQEVGDNTPLHFAVDGESFDISGIKGDKDPAKQLPRPKDYLVKLGKLYTSEDGFLSNMQARATRDTEGWLDIDLRASAQGVQPLEIYLAALSNKRAFRVNCPDFGVALKGMGFTDTVSGGLIDVTGESVEGDQRLIQGKLKVGSFVVKGLPVLARLLNAASPFGFADLISGETSFDYLRGNFKWKGDDITLAKTRAAGSVFGLNVDGKVDLNNGAANLHGTLVPFSFMNKVINYIPLIGNVITGGEGEGVLAAAFTVKGTLEEPNISVNPASLLTPGFLRNLFFSGEDDAPAPSAPPAAAPPAASAPAATTAPAPVTPAAGAAPAPAAATQKTPATQTTR